MTRLLSLAVIAFFTVSSAALCQTEQSTSQPLTLNQAVSVALTNNASLQATRARLGVSQAEIISAAARMNPALVTDNGVAEKTYRLGLQQTFQLGGKVRRRINVARAQQTVVTSQINTAVLDLRTEVRRAYAQLFNNQQRLTTYEEIVATTTKLLDISQRRESAGDISKLDVLQVELVQVSARNDYETAAYQVVLARNNLNNLLNHDLGEEVSLRNPPAPTIPAEQTSPKVLKGSVVETDVNLQQLLERALPNRPELQENASNIEVANRQEALARANRIPNLTVTAGPDLVTEASQKEVNVFLVADLELPILYRQQGEIQQAMAKRQQYQRERDALRRRIILEVTNAYRAFVANQARINRYETELLPKASMAVEKSRRSFEVGKSPILFAITAQQAYTNTRLSYIQALLDYQNVISDLERALGTGL